MIFAIYGVNFENKGAELMLRGIHDKIHEWSPANIVACHLLTGNFQQRNKLGIYHLTERQISRLPILEKYIDPVAHLIPSFLRKKNHLILTSEVDVILDASGFAYSDQWGSKASERMALKCQKWRKENKKIILLPQAFGPFENPRVKEAMITIVNNVDLIFARDQISYDYIKALSIPINHVKIAPDFTNLLQGEKPSYIEKLTNRPCLVPNQRMLDKTGSNASTSYIDFIVSVINNLREKQRNPFILVHETKDINLAEKIASLLSQPIDIIQEENPLCLKYILGQVELLIGSRFHSLISALSQGTPCLGTGWSHKYQTLFAEYNCSDCLINFADSIADNLAKLDYLLDEEHKKIVVEKIKLSAVEQKKLSQSMWINVQSILD